MMEPQRRQPPPDVCTDEGQLIMGRFGSYREVRRLNKHRVAWRRYQCHAGRHWHITRQ